MSAAELRDRRRAKILTNPEERMKKLLGKQPKEDCCSVSDKSNELEVKEEVEEDQDQSHNSQQQQQESTNHNEELQETNGFRDQPHRHEPDRSHVSSIDSNSSTVTTSSWTGNEDGEDNLTETPKNEPSISRISLLHSCVMILLGVLVRLLWTTSDTDRSSLIPFVSVELGLLVIQHLLDIQDNQGTSSVGGLWMYVLHFSGVRPEVLQSYTRIMTIVHSVLDDFAIYFFTFIIIHVTLMTVA